MLGHAGLGVPNLAALGGGLALPSQNIDVGVLVNTQTFFGPLIAAEAAQNLTPAFFNEGDIFHQPQVDQEALAGQILVQHFDDASTDQFPAPLFALEAAQAINVAYFDEGDQFYPPQMLGEGTDLLVSIGRLVNVNEFYDPQFVVSGKEPVYNYPVGRGLYSDYGIRASLTDYKRRMIIGNRR